MRFYEHLGHLAEYDRNHGSELTHTLEVWLRCNTATEAAEVLRVHRNTLLYRLNRIRQITSLDLKNRDTRLTLHLALRADEVVRVA